MSGRDSLAHDIVVVVEHGRWLEPVQALAAVEDAGDHHTPMHHLRNEVVDAQQQSHRDERSHPDNNPYSGFVVHEQAVSVGIGVVIEHHDQQSSQKHGEENHQYQQKDPYLTFPGQPLAAAADLSPNLILKLNLPITHFAGYSLQVRGLLDFALSQ